MRRVRVFMSGSDTFGAVYEGRKSGFKQEKAMKRLIINASPHVASPMDTRFMMKGVIKALIPAIIASLYFFRIQAASVFSASVVGYVVTEYLFQKWRGR